MGRERFVDPTETVTIDIGDGDWIEVKKRLSNGEQRKMQSSAIKTVQGFGPDAKYTPDSDVLGIAEAMAYLVAWSIKRNGKPVPLETDRQRRAALDDLYPDEFEVISQAISKHVDDMAKERAEAKKTQDGATPSPAISPSPSDVTGATSGSVN